MWYNFSIRGVSILGWKFELLNKSGRELSGIIKLTREQIKNTLNQV